MSPVRQPEETRMKILESALELFHQRTFTGTSINEIVEKAGITKGALFHYFKGKNELGYAVVDELLGHSIYETWIRPLSETDDPINQLEAILTNLSSDCHSSEGMIYGCPLNNLSQEMSSRDETFRIKLQDIYRRWAEILEKALKAGIASGNVRSDIDPVCTAQIMVALMEGCIGTIKVYRNLGYMESLGKGLFAYFEDLRPR